jgi:hypothetical protein
MKVYSISRWAFWGICLLIVALPVSRHWRLLSSGEKATGTVLCYSTHFERIAGGDMIMVQSSEIAFQAGDSVCLIFGPDEVHYENGRTFSVFYKPEDPSVNCLVSFSSFYLSDYSILPLVLLIVWAAFYLSFNYYQKQKRPGSRTPAESPYRKTGQGRGSPAGKIQFPGLKRKT